MLFNVWPRLRGLGPSLIRGRHGHGRPQNKRPDKGLYGAELLESRTLLSVALNPPGVDDFGNTFEDSSPIELDGTGAGSQSGVIETAGDVNMFRFVAPMTGRLTVIRQVADTASGSSLDSLLTAYDDAGKQLDRNDDNAPGSTLDSLVEFAVEAGRTYYVQAAAYGSSTGRYTLAVVAFKTDIDLTGSEPVTLTGTLGASEAGAGPSADVFRISPTEDGRLSATVHSQDAVTRLSLLDDQGRLLIQSDGLSRDNPDDVVNLHVPEGTVVYLVVEGLGGAGSYTLTTKFTPSAQPFFPLKMTGPGADSQQLLTIGDFNGDKFSDIAAPDGIHLGVGDGTFRDPSSDLGISRDAVFGLISGYFNDDEWLDLAVSERRDTANGASYDIAVLLGKGDGTFQTPVRSEAGTDPASLVTGYFNDDRQLDLAVVNLGSDHISVLLGKGDGTFWVPVPVIFRDVVPVPHYSLARYYLNSLVTGDFDGDNKLDLAVANKFWPAPSVLEAEIYVLRGNGDGTFEDPVLVGEGAGPSYLVTGDFDGDNKLDLAATNGSYDEISVLLGKGDGTFQKPVPYRAGVYPTSLVTGDFNGDKKLDLAVVNTGDRFYEIISDDISVLRGNGDGTFQDQVQFGVGAYPSSLVTGDFDGDGRPDLATADWAYSDISVLLGKGDGTFQTQVRYRVGGYHTSLVTGDFNGDGWSDLAATNQSSIVGYDDISVLLGKGDGTFQTPVLYRAGAGPSSLVTGDFNGDGRPDLAAANSGSDDIVVLLGNGDGTFQTQVPFKVRSFPTSLVTGYFNDDRKLDLAITKASSPASDSGEIIVLLGNGDGTFQTQNPVLVGEGDGPTSLVTGDFDGDGWPDLAAIDVFWEEPSGYAADIIVLRGNGDGTFQTPVRYRGGAYRARGTTWMTGASLVTGDFNGDHQLDLAATNIGSNDIAGCTIVLLGKGDGTFKTPVRYKAGGYPTSLVTWDFNGDGWPDLAVANNGITVLPGNGNGTFKTPLPFGAGLAGPSSLVTEDFNGDGRPDLAAANFGSDDIVVLLGGLFEDPDLFATAPHATPLLAKLNGDDSNDVVVINAAGDILYRQGRPRELGTFEPPVKVNPGFPAAMSSLFPPNKTPCSPASTPAMLRSRSTSSAAAPSSASDRCPPAACRPRS